MTFGAMQALKKDASEADAEKDRKAGAAMSARKSP